MKPYCIYTLGLILMACATLTACMEEEDAELQTQLVVEGWIEDGGYPVVLLGETHAIDAGMQNIENYIVRWGKVTISDGTDSVVLTGGYDNDFFPPYKYTTFKMTGQAGKTYTQKRLPRWPPSTGGKKPRPSRPSPTPSNWTPCVPSAAKATPYSI